VPARNLAQLVALAKARPGKLTYGSGGSGTPNHLVGELLKLIRERRKLRMNAWLTATGHQRPGVAAGLPLAEAESRAAILTAKIRALP
jgi:hypothetical protein